MPISFDDPEMMREIIIDNYKYPRNKEETKDPNYITIHMDSASCIDDIYVQVLIDKKTDVIQDVKWHGTGCAISSASTSIMSELVKGKTVEEAKKLHSEFDKMLDGKEFSEDELGEAVCFENVNRQPSRITCANISWRGLEKALDEEEKK